MQAECRDGCVDRRLKLKRPMLLLKQSRAKGLHTKHGHLLEQALDELVAADAGGASRHVDPPRDGDAEVHGRRQGCVINPKLDAFVWI